MARRKVSNCAAVEKILLAGTATLIGVVSSSDLKMGRHEETVALLQTT